MPSSAIAPLPQRDEPFPSPLRSNNRSILFTAAEGRAAASNQQALSNEARKKETLLNGIISVLQVDLDSLTGKIVTLEENAIFANQEGALQQGNIAKLETNDVLKNGMLSVLNANVASLIGKIEALEENGVLKDEEIASLRGKTVELEGKLIDTDKRMDRLSALVDKLSSAVP